MIVQTKNNKTVAFRRLTTNDFEQLNKYLNNLSEATLKRFGPHRFDRQSVIDFYTSSNDHWGFIAQDLDTENIVAYAIVKKGHIQKDALRLQALGLALDTATDCTFAPSVTDDWQGFGVGNQLFAFVLDNIKNAGLKRMILWGGVEADNHKAVNYYVRNGFELTGKFWRNGDNYDMVLNI
jgi:diamine N-acetyltransferase